MVEREGQRCENGRGSSGRRREGGGDGYHCAAEIPDVLSNNQPSDCTVGALPPFSVPSLPSLACRFPPQIDLAIGRLAFPQWRWRRERKGIGRERKLRRHRRRGERHHNRAGVESGDSGQMRCGKSEIHSSANPIKSAIHRRSISLLKYYCR